MLGALFQEREHRQAHLTGLEEASASTQRTESGPASPVRKRAPASRHERVPHSVRRPRAATIDSHDISSIVLELYRKIYRQVNTDSGLTDSPASRRPRPRLRRGNCREKSGRTSATPPGPALPCERHDRPRTGGSSVHNA